MQEARAPMHDPFDGEADVDLGLDLALNPGFDLGFGRDFDLDSGIALSRRA